MCKAGACVSCHDLRRVIQSPRPFAWTSLAQLVTLPLLVIRSTLRHLQSQASPALLISTCLISDDEAVTGRRLTVKTVILMPSTSQPLQATFELQDMSTMDKIKSMFRPKPDYEPLQNDIERDDDASLQDDGDEVATGSPFSWVEYGIFLLLGIAMLWAW